MPAFSTSDCKYAGGNSTSGELTLFWMSSIAASGAESLCWKSKNANFNSEIVETKSTSDRSSGFSLAFRACRSREADIGVSISFGFCSKFFVWFVNRQALVCKGLRTGSARLLYCCVRGGFCSRDLERYKREKPLPGGKAKLSFGWEREGVRCAAMEMPPPRKLLVSAWLGPDDLQSNYAIS